MLQPRTKVAERMTHAETSASRSPKAWSVENGCRLPRHPDNSRNCIYCFFLSVFPAYVFYAWRQKKDVQSDFSLNLPWRGGYAVLFVTQARMEFLFVVERRSKRLKSKMLYGAEDSASQQATACSPRTNDGGMASVQRGMASGQRG